MAVEFLTGQAILICMSKRQYEQVCALSVALDILGDRWTLLILRELLFGDRRYSDILRGVPAMGTNLLSRRLKELEQSGVITQAKLPPPAAATVYQFTPSGRENLLPIIHTLTNFGVQHLQYPPVPGHFVPASSTMGAMSKFFVGGDTAVTETVQFYTKDDAFHCIVEAGQYKGAGFGLAPTEPTLVLRGTTDVFMGLVVRYVAVKTAVADKALTIEQGDKAKTARFFNAFSRP